MNIAKCDICDKISKKKISFLDEKSKWISGNIRGRGDTLSFDLCGKCGENLLKYVKRYLKPKKNAKK